MDIWYRRDSGLEALISRIQSEGKDTEGMTVPGVAPKIGSKVKWGNIYGSIADQTDLKAILDELQREIEEGIVSGKVFVYKGQVPTYNDLPNDAKAGDVWDVADTGYNYVWSGESWDNLSSSVDLSEYAKIDDVTELINQTVISIQTELQSLDDKKADTTYVIELNNSVVDGVNAEINARKAADITLQNNIDKVAEDLQRHIDEAETGYVTNAQFNEEKEIRANADTTLQTNIDKVASDLAEHIADADQNTATKQELADETNARIAADNLLDDRLDVLENKDFVEYKDISNPENPNRKAIILNNHDGIFGKDTEGNTRTLGMISKYNVADFGNPHLHTNLNTQQIVTVNDNQAVLTDKNMDQVILSGDNVIIDKETKVDPTTGFSFQTLTINAELSGTDHRIDEIAANLEQEVQARTEKDTALENKFNNYMDIETTANYVTGEIDNLANTVSQLYVGKSEIYDNYLVDYYQKTETYSKDQVDELIQDIDAGQLRADLDQEIQDRQTADEALDTRIDALEAKTEAIFHYKGTIATVGDLPQNAEIGDVYNVEETGSNYAYDGENWDKLSETIDLTPYMTKDDFNNKVWNKQANYFETKATTNKGTAIIWNESDGGGSKYEGKDGLWSYTGVNEGTANKVSDTEGNILSGRANEVMGQIYVYDSTNTISEKGNKGSWIDMTLDGFYYKKGTNSNVTLDNEIAVVGQVNAVQNGLDTLQETVDDTLAYQDGNIQNLLLQMETLEKKIEDLKSLDYEVVTFYDGGETQYNNPIKDFQLSGAITSPAIITSNSVTLKESTMAATYMDLYADNDITVKQSTFNGSVPKATSNAIMKLRANGYITVRDYTFTIEKAYNAIECNLSEAIAKSIVIDNVNFDGPLSNNAINIFGMANGGVVTIANCHFKKVSNMLRISNRLNTNWTINIINCTVDEWDVGQYGGAILLQDYVSKSAEEVATRNEFKNLTINIQNLTKPDGTKVVPCDLSTICGTQDNNQLIYVYDSYNGVRAYDETIYPTINIQ